MASATELIRKRDEKLREFSEWNLKVEAKKLEYQTLDKKVSKLQSEYDSIIEKIEIKLAELATKQEAFDASVDRSHLAFAYSVEELNQQAIKKQDELKALFQQIEAIGEELVEVQENRKRTLAESSRLEKKLGTLRSDEVKVQTRLEKAQLKLQEAKDELGLTRQTNRQVVAETVSLRKREKHLELMEKRIRNYYKKAELTFRPYR